MKKNIILTLSLLILLAVCGQSAFADSDIATLPGLGEFAVPGSSQPEQPSQPQQPATLPDNSYSGGGSAASAPAQNPPAQSVPTSNPQPVQNSTQTAQSNSQSVQLTPIGTPQPAPTTSAAPTPAAAAPSPTPEAAPMESAPPEPSAPAETPGDGADRYLRVAVVLGLSGMVVVALALNGASKRRKRRGKRRR